ncbi:hypothetical protein GCM10027088_22810 [Nocardia goodfellowii]
MEQRMPGPGAGRVEGLDQLLEWQLGVLEGSEIGVTHLPQQCGERRGGVDRRAQRQGVHEHADEFVQRPVAPARDRRADDDVGAARHPGQQRRETGVQHHER